MKQFAMRDSGGFVACRDGDAEPGAAVAGFFVRSGAGVIRAVIEDPSVVAVGNGYSWQVGLGYDIPLGSLALTPYVTYLNSLEVALDVNDVSTGFNVNPNILQVGLALTVR